MAIESDVGDGGTDGVISEGAQYTPREVSRLGVAALACSVTGTVLGIAFLLAGLFIVIVLNAAGVALGVACLAVAGHKRRSLSLSLAAISVGVVGAVVVYVYQFVVLSGRMH